MNTKIDKNKLIRIVRNNENEIKIDITGKKEGRGTYICKSQTCLEKAKKTKKIERALKIEVPSEIYDKLKNIIDGGEFIG